MAAGPPLAYHCGMPRYEFRCRECVGLGEPGVFEVNRPMSAAGDPATCPVGHGDTVKLLSAIALTGSGGGFGGAPAPAAGGGCCGGACGCG
ncbi:hypothetical protein GCM10023321_68620 [Pseudonocardia eucalypti]|uniref:Putative regulatory protein FmdB zinc ribbon domain-containing protein n=2 Tax=Pseudonocardia eucalypti TaxID=648755 RepID=A0ABP9R2S2_9PSEU